MIDHKLLPAMIDLYFDLAAPNLRKEVLCLKSNASKILWSYFLALGFLTVTDWLSDIGMLLLNTSGVEAIDDSIIAL